MFNRQTPLGVPDESGRFPVIAGVKMLKNYIPPEYIEDLNNDDSITDKQAVLNSVLAINQSYPYDTYYPYSKDASICLLYTSHMNLVDSYCLFCSI